MKTLISLIPLVFLSCAPVAQNDLSGSGAIGNAGKAEGNWTIYSDASSSVIAKGAFLDGRPHGPWEIWDDAGVKNAELDFENGVYNGQYRLYYTGLTPEAVGSLKTVGRTVSGTFSGEYVRYDLSGRVLVRYTGLNNAVTTVQEGLRVDADEQIAADIRLLENYRTAILAAQKKRAAGTPAYTSEPIYR